MIFTKADKIDLPVTSVSSRSKLILVISLLILLPSKEAFSQTGIYAWEELEKRISSAKTIDSLGENPFGEMVNLSDGALSFSARDVEVPGNNSLSVGFGRKYSVRNRRGYTTDSMLGDWDVDIPSISGTYLPNWEGSASLRCSNPGPPPSYPVEASSYWNGVHLDLPGAGETELLTANVAVPSPADGAVYKWTAKGDIHVSCLPTIKNGAGEGFLVRTADGVKYRFDWMGQNVEPDIQVYNGLKYARRKNVLYPTSIEDRFGNTVSYTYLNAWNSPGRLNRIESSDGRVVSVTYNASGHIATVLVGSRQWQYSYTDIVGSKKSLSSVTLPDGSKWAIGFTQFTLAEVRYPSPTPVESVRDCFSNPVPNSPTGNLVGSISHPAGAAGSFTVALRNHMRSNVPVFCLNYSTIDNDTNDDVNRWPFEYETFTILSKRINAGAGVPQMDWGYDFRNEGGSFWLYYPGATLTNPCPQGTNCGAPICTSDGCAGKRISTVSEPGGTWRRYTFGNSYRYNEGKLLREEVGSGTSPAISAKAYSYDFTGQNGAYTAKFGSSPRGVDDSYTSEYRRPLLRTDILQQGATFTSQIGVFDNFARPLSVTNSSSLGYSRVETREYNDDQLLWVVGQIKRTTIDGVESTRTEFGWKSAPTKAYAFGKARQTFGYFTDGTLASVKDGNGYETTFSNWKRGAPQTITYADATQRLAVVNDAGWISSVTDENGYKSCYTQDAMGRLASITYPSESAGICDESVWAKETFAFTPVQVAEHGLSPGHWTMRRRLGNRHLNTYYDALWQPVLEESLDYADAGNSLSQVVKRYDAHGRLTFQSHPMRGVGNLADVTVGTWTEYDAQGKVTFIKQDSELGQLITQTQYLDGFRTLMINPKGQQTTTSYMAYDQPTTEWPRAIVHPEGTYTDITRDAFGKPQALMRRDSSGAISLTRSYSYHVTQELCKAEEPETGSTLMGYDAAGNLAWSAAGLAAGSICDPTGTASSVIARKVARTYDTRNRLKTLSFPDGKGDQVWIYAPDGLPSHVTTYNFSGLAGPVLNTYSYNSRRLLISESQQHSGQLPNTIAYAYNANGHPMMQTYPSGLQVNFAPNALGQPTQAGIFATAVSYHPNGAIKQFVYGNGITHQVAQNNRQLPSRITDSEGTLDLGYTYDNNSNVAAITDYASGARQTRSLSYDNLDRLTGANGVGFGTATYGYDVLDNLTRMTVTGGNNPRNYGYVYDGSNRLTNITNGVGGASLIGLSYDVQGNLSNKNGATHLFDFGNRLRSTPSEWSYMYDAYGRRVSTTKSYSNPRFRYFMYSRDGKLAYSYNTTSYTLQEYIHLGGNMIALRGLSGNIPNSPPAVAYFHNDALGTAIARTNATKVVIQSSEYEAYGQPANHALTDGPGFTGHVQDSSTGFTYMQQRYYDQLLGRFLSVDPVAASTISGANFNRFSYASNNPYLNVDPDGRDDSPFSVMRSASRNRELEGTDPVAAKKASRTAMMFWGAVFAGPLAWEAGVAAAANPVAANSLATTVMEVGMGDALGSASLGAAGTATLYRVVDDMELDDILKRGMFSASPNGDGVKRFLDNLPDAKALQKKFQEFFGVRQTIVEGAAPKEVMESATKTRFSDVPGRPMDSVNVPSSQVNRIKCIGIKDGGVEDC